MFSNGSRVMTAILALNFLAVAIVGVMTFQRTQRFDPLGDYPVQSVETGRDVDGEPIVSVDGAVTVTGTKCNDSDEPVTIRGTLSWVAVDPPGTIVEVGEGVALREPGCVTQRFENPIPVQVQQRTGEIALNRNVAYVEWRITGTEIPVAPNGAEGVPRTWTTETFRVVP